MARLQKDLLGPVLYVNIVFTLKVTQPRGPGSLSSELTLVIRIRVVYMKILVKFEVFPTVLRLVPVDREVRRARRFCLWVRWRPQPWRVPDI